jgi:tRNA(Ile)-lysidine synthase
MLRPCFVDLLMLNKVRKTIVQHAMLERGERLIAAVSGGPDSVALLKALTLIAAEFNLSLVVAHLNHGLRGAAADAEEEFVCSLSRSMNVECVSGKIDIAALKEPGKSLEELCREQRYAFLKKVAADCRATKIALGHHLQDQAETVLMNLLRGSGAEGLRGMLPVREGLIIRPLLQVTRKEILAFLQEMGISFTTDSSNAHDCYLRNRIRHNLLPLMKEGFNRRVEENLSRTAEIMRLDDDYLAIEVEEWLCRWGISGPEGDMRLPLTEFLKLHPALQQRVIKNLLASTSRSGQGIGYKHVSAALALARGSHGSASLDLPGGVLLRREYHTLIFSRLLDRPDVPAGRRIAVNPNYRYPVNVPGQVEVKEAGLSINFQFADKPDQALISTPGAHLAYLDYGAIHPPLVIRNVIPGDWLQPLGMTGKKKLKALFIDEKVPSARRHLLPLLADQQSVIWVPGLRISSRVSVTEKTRQVLKVEII